MKAKVDITSENVVDVVSNGSEVVTDALVGTINKEEEIEGLSGYTDEELDWDSIPESEKVSDDEVDFMEAREAGMWDGVNDVLNKRVQDALAEKDGKKLKELREEVESGKFAEQFQEQGVPEIR